MSEDFGFFGDEFMLGDCREDWDFPVPPEDLDDEEDVGDLFEEDDCPLDGDFDSAMASAGMGMDEDYNHYDYGDY